MFEPASLFQILVLAAGIYIVLGFLSAQRGGGLVRGIVVALLVVTVGVWWLAKLAGFEELEHIIESMAGYAFIVFAIVFQPELRRGIAQLGVPRLIGRYLSKKRLETVPEVSAAVGSMARRRVGALIAFERDQPLDDFVQSGVPIDATVHRTLIESIFHPGGKMHDGAIVIRKDRVAAALCLFPLTENVEIAKSVGTRHRAALGLTDETDAVTIAVSEETGKIAVCQDGRMEPRVPAKELESVLRQALSAEGAEAAGEDDGRTWTERLASAARTIFLTDAQRKLAALVVAAGLFYVAHQSITVEVASQLRVVASQPDGRAQPSGGELLIVLSDPELRLVEPSEAELIDIVAQGTRGEAEDVTEVLAGRLDVHLETPAQGVGFPLDDVTWTRVDGVATSLDVRLATAGLRLKAVRVARRSFPLDAGHLDVDATRLDPRFEARTAAVTFEPTTVTVEGPRASIDELGTAARPLVLETLQLAPDDRREIRVGLGLSPELVDAGFELFGVEAVIVTLPVDPAPQDLSVLEKEIAVVDTSMSPGGLERWTLPSHGQTARYRIRTAGILPSGEEDPERQHLSAAVRRFVEANLIVFVDVAEIDAAAGRRSVRIRHAWRRDWREALASEVEALDERARLDVVLESDLEVLLVEADTSESAPPRTEDEG